MTNTFKEMYDAYNACTSKQAKSALNDAMITYAKEVRTGYAYYDMDMYTSLYKCAETPKQCKNEQENSHYTCYHRPSCTRHTFTVEYEDERGKDDSRACVVLQ